MKPKKLINKKFENIYHFFEALKKCKLDFSTNREMLIQNELLNKDFNNTSINKISTKNKRNDNFIVINYILSDKTRTILSLNELEPNVEFNNKLDEEKKRIFMSKFKKYNLLNR